MSLILSAPLKSHNLILSTAILGLLPTYFTALSQFPTNSTQTKQLSTALTLLLPIDKLADSKEKIRILARNTFISAGLAALRATPVTDKDSPWSYLQRIVEENGFGSKNSKVREQVSYTNSPPELLLTRMSSL